MGGKRGRGADKGQRKTRPKLTDEQKMERADKIAKTKADRKAKESAARRSRFIQLMAGGTNSGENDYGRASEGPNQNTNSVPDNEIVNDAPDPSATFPDDSFDTNGEVGNATAAEGEVENEDEIIVTFTEDIPREIEHAPIIANLDVDCDDDDLYRDEAFANTA